MWGVRLKKLHLDTTYILPILGVGLTIKNFNEEMENLLKRSFSIQISPLSLVEAKWITIRLYKRDPTLKASLRKKYSVGVDILLKSEKIRLTNLTSKEVEEEANKLEDLGVTDYFDRMIAATAIKTNATLITEDNSLQEVVKKNYTIETMNWRTLRKELQL